MPNPNGYFDTFFAREGRAKKLYPVIHILDSRQALENARTAFENGADGIFLISHNGDTEDVLAAHALIATKYPRRFIGVNFLDRPQADYAFSAVVTRPKIAALWCDNSGIGDRIHAEAGLLAYGMSKVEWPGYYFASVAFKYQPLVQNVALAAANGEDFAHVVVTSGTGTGSAPAVDKIAAMKEAIPDHPLAIASGMTCDNIHQFLPCADIFMVATGISSDEHTLDARLVDQMATIIKNYNKSTGLL